MPDNNYKDYEKLIKKTAWSWHKTTGIDLEELIAEANVAFTECLNNHDPAKGKFSTLLIWHTKNKFRNLLTYRNQLRHDGTEIELENLTLSSPATQERKCIFKNTLTSLSKDARQIISITLNAPADLIAMLPKSMINREQLTKYLRFKKGWKITAINKAYIEIKKCF